LRAGNAGQRATHATLPCMPLNCYLAVPPPCDSLCATKPTSQQVRSLCRLSVKNIPVSLSQSVHYHLASLHHNIVSSLLAVCTWLSLAYAYFVHESYIIHFPCALEAASSGLSTTPYNGISSGAVRFYPFTASVNSFLPKQYNSNPFGGDNWEKENSTSDLCVVSAF